LKIELKSKQVINFRHDWTIFLGFIIKGSPFKKWPIRTNKRGVKFRVTPRPCILLPMKSILSRLVDMGFIIKGKYGIKPTSLRRLIHYPLYNIIDYYNSIYRGFAYYYKISTFHNPLRNLNYILRTSCLLTIALKMKLKTIHKVIKRYGKDLNIIENQAGISFVKWDIWKRKPKDDTYFTYEPSESIRTFTSFGYVVKLMVNEGCEKCGFKENDLQLHYVNSRKNINNKSFVLRKQILLCRLCHSKIYIGHV
jgi:hypothetical protein